MTPDFSLPADGVPSAWLRCTPDGIIDAANPPAAKLLAYDDPTGRDLADLVQNATELPQNLSRWRRTTASLPARWTVRTGTGEDCELQVWGRRAGTDDDRIIIRLGSPDRSGFVELDRRIDDLHREIARRRDLERQLEELVGETLVNLERTNRDLTRYAHAVAHDLRSPLVSMRGFAELIDEAEDDKEVRHFAERIQKGAEHALELVRDLLTEAERAPALEPVDLQGVMTWVSEILAGEIDQTSTYLRVGDLPVVEGRRAGLRHVLFNLVRNAIVHNDAPEPVVRVTADRAVNAWEIRVEDNGPGVAPDRREELFDSGPSTGNGDEVHGLGLPGSRVVALELGGDLNVEHSQDLGGAAFVLRLPV